jgi:putative endopeptidase
MHKLQTAGKWMAAGMLVAVCSAGASAQSQKVPAFEVSSLDRNIQPCADFDGFANENWKKANPIPGTESRWGAFNILDKENKEVRLKSIINEIAKRQGLAKGTEEQQIADYYASFLDTVTIEKRGINPLRHYIEKIDGIKTLADWARVCGELQTLGVSTWAGFAVEADAKDSRMNAVYGGQDGLSLGERSYYERDDESTKNVRKEFEGHVNKMFSLAGFREQNPGKTILDFETGIAKLQLTNVELRDPVKTYNKLGFAQLLELAPEFDWKEFTAQQGLHTDTVVVQDKPYLTNGAKLLKTTPISTLKTYTKFQLLSTFAGYLPKRFDDENFRFFATVMTGRKAQRPRADRAIRSTDGILGMPLGKLFAKKYFPEASKQKVSEMIENVRTVYGERIDKLAWMSPATKQMAHKKLKAFTYKIGYPDTWKDYSSIDIKKDALIENIISAARYRNEERNKKVGKAVDKSEWLMTPQTVNAYYNPLNNEIVFPAGILQPPFFNADADDAINYGGIIAVIGHEFTHGFDDQGSQFDADGNLQNWWTEDDRKNFDALSKKYIDYFGGLEPLPGFKINGALTIGENIADLGGLTLAYYALQKSLEGKPEPALIDGFNWKQRFFLGWAQVWHANTTDAALRNQIQTDPHSPARYRINGPLPHLAEFKDAWQCAEDSKMVIPAAQRVVIW